LAKIRSAIKAIRSSGRKRLRNRIVISSTRTYVRKARVSLQSGTEADAQAAVRRAVIALDKAAQKGVIHRNKAARTKSRLMRQLNQGAG
jgi:small subunit ribosomal protein S20